MSFLKEIQRRRTFGIISHPDAGKTTLTEKLLLFGGAIQEAGAVKNNKIKKGATSDFMEIERQRGISVATSVLAFLYKDKKINILDTPGHKDFAEDTFRTLTAVDSVIVVIDVAKGVEEQTEKLVAVCRMRNIPIIVFINKLDREGKDAFDLMDEVEKKLGLSVTPLSFPIGMGYDFQGIYNIWEQNINLFSGDSRKNIEDTIAISDLNSPELEKIIGEKPAGKLREELELIEEVYPKFNAQEYLAGNLQPVFFGSALNNFGVRELLDCFIEIAPSPRAKESDTRLVKPDEEKMSGFVFKIHANIDPRHRDRIAFLRVCSGEFHRNKFYHHVRLDKDFKYPNPVTFMASAKSTIDEAFAGDVIGLYDTGNFKIGDTLTEGEVMTFKGIPNFSPEIFKELVNRDPMKSKQLDKGIRQLTEEGVAQLFIQEPGNRKIVGTVGELQFEVIKYRLEHEYGAKCEFEAKTYYKACWITTENPAKLEEFRRIKGQNMVMDKEGNDVFLAPSSFMLDMERKNYPELEFHFTSEFKITSVN